jgi:hypothetical protein
VANLRDYRLPKIFRQSQVDTDRTPMRQEVWKVIRGLLIAAMFFYCGARSVVDPDPDPRLRGDGAERNIYGFAPLVERIPGI